MLNRSHAQASSLYNKLMQKIMQLSNGIDPELNTRFDWIIARYVRWCALHAAGGGWMSDYDVANKGFTPQIAQEVEEKGTLQINAGQPACLFYATQEHCANAIRKFTQEPLAEGKEMFFEANVLGILTDLHRIMPLVSHATEANGLPRSAAMKNACEE
jgi:hypothetical protein